MISAIRKIRISRAFRLFLLLANMLVLLVNLFVGLLVYQNPVVALMDWQNLTSLFFFGTVLTGGSYIIYLLACYLEQRELLTKSR
jgi:DMSO reductase anchor subunit